MTKLISDIRRKNSTFFFCFLAKFNYRRFIFKFRCRKQHRSKFAFNAWFKTRFFGFFLTEIRRLAGRKPHSLWLTMRTYHQLIRFSPILYICNKMKISENCTYVEFIWVLKFSRYSLTKGKTKCEKKYINYAPEVDCLQTMTFISITKINNSNSYNLIRI